MTEFEPLAALLAMGPAPGNGSGQSTAPWYVQMFPFLLLIFVFYFVLIRPQQKKAKEQAEMLKGLRPGDKVTTSSGIVGVITSVKERTVVLRSNDSKLELTKAAISDITERGADSSSAS